MRNVQKASAKRKGLMMLLRFVVRSTLAQKLVLFLLKLFYKIFKTRIMRALSKRKVMLGRLHYILNRVLLNVKLKAPVGVKPVR
jgi:hypothetical protein